MTDHLTQYIESPADEVQLLDAVLADLGSVVRRSRFGTLEEADFDGLMARARARLKALRAARQAEADLEPLELTEAGRAYAAATEVALDLARVKRGITDAFGIKALFRGSELPTPVRTHGHLSVFDGGPPESSPEARP